jgi:enterochelin esterase-like enzyme
MPIHRFTRPRGKFESFELESAAVANNTLGDPTLRTVTVYLPEAYDAGNEDYPLLVDIVGFTGSGLAHLNWKAFDENVPQRLDRLIEEGKMGPVVLAFPDCFTSLGGNQYINSSVLGNWADFLTLEMLPELERRYRLKPGREHRGLFGKSSGGYGSMIHGMLYAEHWGAVACHSGDMSFDLCYRGDFPKTLMHLAAHEDDISAFLQGLREKQKISGDDMHALMMLAMAATYDPAPELPAGVRLPVDPETCEMDETLWNRWLAWDPVQLIERPEVQQNLASLRGLLIDCGFKDQYSLVFGARALKRRLEALGIEHHYEEFADNHSSIDYRMDVSLPYLYNCLKSD